MIDVTKMIEDEVKKHLNVMVDLDDNLDECKTCGLPDLLHKGVCMRKTQADTEEECKIWKEYRDMIKPIVFGLKRRKSLEDQQTNLNNGLQNLIDTMEKKWSK